MDHRLPAGQRLKSRRDIALLFSGNARTKSAYPLRMVYRVVADPAADGPATLRAAFTVPKRRFKRAVDRNLLKRRLREAYRLQKPELDPTLAPGLRATVIFIYTGQEILPFPRIYGRMGKLTAHLTGALRP